MAVGQMFAAAFPDGKLEIRHIHVAGDTAVVEFSARATHQGELMGIAPTGRKIEMSVCTIIDTKNGKIVAEREYMDMAHLLQQLGAMPAPAHA
jgi:predicted ester cyclase